MTALRILTFNWHEAYICLLARTGHDFRVVDKNKGGQSGWLKGTRPVPRNVHLLPVGSEDHARDRSQAGEFDLVICQNVGDLALLRAVRIPKILVFHNRLSTEIELARRAGQPVPTREGHIADLRSLFDDLTFAVFISDAKRTDAPGIDGRVVLPGIDLDEYGGYRGELTRVLRVGNFFSSRDIVLGQAAAAQIIRDTPVTVLGINPDIPGSRLSNSWSELKEFYRSHRIYLNTTVDGYEDGYNLSMLEAMASGMPVVSSANRTSPIRDGENGYVSIDFEVLRDRIGTLLADRDHARALGSCARQTVEELFPLERFVNSWNEIFDSARRTQPHREGNEARRRVDSGNDGAAHFPAEIQRLMMQGAWAKARPLIEAAIEANPDSAKLRKAAGTIYRNLGREPDALRAFWAAMMLNPHDDETMRLHLEGIAGHGSFPSS